MSGEALVNTSAVEWPHPDSAYFTVRRMQAKLHRWAGGDPSRRFGDLFNLVYDPAFLGQIRDSLKSGGFTPVEVRQVMIPKANGKLRKLGIPTIADRVVQASLKLVLEPIFEADFQPCSYGFRPNRRA